VFIAVYLIICLHASNRATCSAVPVIDSTQDDTISMSGCMGLQGFATAMNFWNTHTELHAKFEFGGWACRVGNKKAPDNGGA